MVNEQVIYDAIMADKDIVTSNSSATKVVTQQLIESSLPTIKDGISASDDALNKAIALAMLARKDNCIDGLLTEKQATHEGNSRRAGMSYWRPGKYQNSQKDRVSGKYESCVYLLTDTVQDFVTPGMGLDLDCFSSFLSGSQKNQMIINDYVARKEDYKYVTPRVKTSVPKTS